MHDFSPQNRKAVRHSIGTRLRKARLNRHITGKDLANHLQVRNDALSKMELGHQAIPADLLVDWCNALQVPLQAITLGDESDDLLQALPARYAQIYTNLCLPHRRLVLKHLELVAQMEASGRPEWPGD